MAAFAVGSIADRGSTRSVWRTAASFLAGSAVIYACGVPWLMVAADIDLARAVALGVTPFLIGDALKAAAAGGLLPATWRLLGRGRPRATGERAAR